MKKRKKSVEINDEDVNLGLDADHSSESPSMATLLNDDNERISGNQDGENDNGELNSGIYAPLDDK